MSGIPFITTRAGRALLERDVPVIALALQQIAAELKRLNDHLQFRDTPDDPSS